MLTARYLKKLAKHEKDKRLKIDILFFITLKRAKVAFK
jgi:hypothetical protein|tara:strand:+ start:1532 stop:1645 length:114 start_codon:yes stop_codon:yes gene_type:complete